MLIGIKKIPLYYTRDNFFLLLFNILCFLSHVSLTCAHQYIQRLQRTSFYSLMLVPQGDVPTVLSAPDHYRFRVAGRSTPQSQIAILLGGQGIRRVVQIHDIGRYHHFHVAGLRAKFVFTLVNGKIFRKINKNFFN